MILKDTTTFKVLFVG